MSTAATDRFTRRGRSGRAIAVLLATWSVLLVLRLSIGASGWVLGVLALATLPLAWDILRDRESGVSLGPADLTWQSGFGHGAVPLGAIEHLRLSRRFDLSLRVTVVLRDGTRRRLPPDATPPENWLTAAAARHGLRVESHPFALMG